MQNLNQMNRLSGDTESKSNQIFFFEASKQPVNTEVLFDISTEGEKLRVKNHTINCLFSHLDSEEFSIIYNEFFKHLNLDFTPLEIENVTVQLSEEAQNSLIQRIITAWIYYYTINGLEVNVVKSNFEHPSMVDYVLMALEGKFGVDTNKSLGLGARILRQTRDDYERTVKSRRRYYDR